MSDTSDTSTDTSGSADGSGDSTPSGSGEKHADISLNLDSAAIQELIEKHTAATDAAEKKAGTATHQLSIDVSGMTWAQVQSKLGTTDFLPEVKASLTPTQASHPEQAELHTELIEQHWGDIGGAALKTGLGGSLDYTDGKGVSGKLDVTQDIVFKEATIEAQLQTDFTSGTPQVTGTMGIKFHF